MGMFGDSKGTVGVIGNNRTSNASFGKVKFETNQDGRTLMPATDSESQWKNPTGR